MAREFPRSRRLEEQVQRSLSEALRRARDPRIQQAVITAARVSRDLSVAWVYVAPLDPAQPTDQLAAGLERARGFLRSALARELRVRQVPELRFRIDDTSRRAAEMDALIEAARRRDQAGGPPGQQED
ncbi:MAG: 30S ribosome-binding factor RbfA [Gammaproteobacteria bacterium]|nr:MAG: 30S ribosome-binding factor RbfA [Gammaproteobacteria bacterium]